MKSALAYERYAHGEAPSTPSNEDLQRMDELARADREFLEGHPTSDFFRDMRGKLRRRAHARWAILGPAMAASLALAIGGLALAPKDDGTRMKGGEVNMFVYHKTDGGSEILDAETALAKGDEIQIAYYARDHAYAAILSVDGRGAVTRHMPLHGANALEIETKDFALLPYSYRLDDAPGYEDLYFVVSPKPFKVDSLTPYLIAAFDNNAADILLPAPFRHAAVRVKKTEARQ